MSIQFGFFLKYVRSIILCLMFASPIIFTGCSDEPGSEIEPPIVEISSPGGVSDSTQLRPLFTDSLDVLTTDEILERMTLRQKIGQLFSVRARGYFQNEESEEYQELLKKVQDYQVGGVIFFKGTVYGQTILTNKLQEKSRIPLWISQDMEFGAAMRVEGTTRITPAMGIGATGDPNYGYWAGKITGEEAKALGVNQIFAPVLDVNNNPQNPVINVRSFSGDPDIVADFGTRFISGVSDAGVISTGKHFPGHGDTDTDSHYALPVINADYARLDSVELVPFKAAIQENIPSIMSAHINFPEISKNPGRPSTLDRSILDRILIDSLGFQGLIVTDGLEMRGISAHYSPGEAIRMALQAGADIMLLSPDELKAINELEEAVHDGSISEERINHSVRKLLEWKRGAGLFDDPTINIQQLSKKIHSQKNQLRADEISRQSLTLLRNEDNIIPIKARRYPRILVLSVSNDNDGDTGHYLATQIRRYHPAVRFEVFDRRTGSEEQANILHDARWADLIVIGSYVRVSSRGNNQFNNRQRRFLDRLPGQTPKVLLALGNPYVVYDMPDAEVQLLAWDDSEDQVENTIPALFGLSAISGQLPINIPGMYALGDGLRQSRASRCFDAPEAAGLLPEKLRKVDTIMRDAIANKTFPGGVVAVVKDGMMAYCNAFGYHTYDKDEQVAPNDVYDLASLTKVVATTTSIMKLVDQGKVKLNDPVSKYFPEFGEGAKADVKIRHLLLHTSGLPAFRVYVDKLKTRAEIVKAVKNEPLIHQPNTTYEYSDLGFILLGEIVKQVTGMRIDEYAKKTFYEPLGMESTGFNPKERGAWLSSRIPPTEIDENFRMKTVQAEAHDERAWYMDGVAGHAGLFSNVQDLSIFAQMLLNEGAYAGKRYINPKTIRRFTSKQSDLNERGYGFDRKSPTGFTTAGQLSSPNTFGHLGFTGTSLWVDPEKNMAVILLTNRTYPKRTYGKNISRIRAEVADAVFSSIKNP